MKILIMTVDAYCAELKVDRTESIFKDSPGNTFIVYDEATKQVSRIESNSAIVITSDCRLQAIKEPFLMTCQCADCVALKSPQEPRPNTVAGKHSKSN